MTVYIASLLMIVSLYSVLYKQRYRSNTKIISGEVVWLFIAVSIVVLIWGLRDITVGLDTRSYSILYSWASGASISEYNRYWIEPGYAFLTMFFSQVLHLDYHQFIIVVSVFCGYSLYVFIKRYSKNYLISIITFFSFPLMAFYMSAMRNILVISIMLLSIRLLERKTFWRIMLYEGIIIISSIAFHKSGLICTLIPLFAYNTKKKRDVYVYGVVTALLFLTRGLIYQFINSNYKSVGSADSISIGTTIIVYAFLFILLALLHTTKKTPSIDIGAFDIDLLSIRLFYWAVVGQLLSNGGSDILLRMVFYFQMFFVIGIPNCLHDFDQNQNNKILINVGTVALLLVIFYILVIESDPYGIVPYSLYNM